MKKLICNIGSLALGVLASIMAFVNMFDVKITLGEKSTWAETTFGIFAAPDKAVVTTFDLINDGFADTFRVIAMVVAIVAIAAFAILAIAIVLDFLSGKKSKMAGIKKLASLVLIITAILFAVAVIIFTLSNKVTADAGSTAVAISNWFAFLSVVIGFAGSGLLAMCAKK